MRVSRTYVPTLKEAPREAEIVSHQLLLRAGYIRKLAAGIYSFLPLGWRVVRKVEEIVREEMDRAGALEVRLPAVQPAELWRESGRWDVYGPELLRFRDRKQGEFCLGPTHEEVITDLVRGEVRSYRQLPLNLYQMQTKFRDEIRPRAGLMRGREFIMKDAYSFDASVEGAKRSYQAMYEAYERIFRRCGLAFRAVEADSGNIGGSMSHEFQVLAASGEDAIVSCPACGYTANVEQADVGRRAATGVEGSSPSLERVDTPGQRKAEEVARFLGIEVGRVVKTLVYRADDTLVAALVPGDRELNEIQWRKRLGAERLEPATPAEIVEAGALVGFVGPVGLRVASLWLDATLEGERGLVVGANEEDAHFIGFDPARDAPEATVASVAMARGGDPCGRCGGSFEAFKGIEVGHVFYLGTKYSQALGATVNHEGGDEAPLEMGCYGIGVTRIVAAAIEQHHDGDGICWPVALAPYPVHVLALQPQDSAVMEAAARLETALSGQGLEPLVDDRDIRPGAKFKDADLVGLPWRVTLSQRGLAAGEVEVRERSTGVEERLPLDAVVPYLQAKIAEALRG